MSDSQLFLQLQFLSHRELSVCYVTFSVLNIFFGFSMYLTGNRRVTHSVTHAFIYGATQLLQGLPFYLHISLQPLPLFISFLSLQPQCYCYLLQCCHLIVLSCFICCMLGLVFILSMYFRVKSGSVGS